MQLIFGEYKAKVLVAERSSATRTQLVDIIRQEGFSDITGVSTIKEALGVLEAEKIDWLITSLMPEDKENGLHILKISTRYEKLREMKVTFLLEENEFDNIPLAFQYGLLSWHRKPFTKDSLSKDIHNLIEKSKELEWRAPLIAADYLREFLLSQNRIEEIVNLEKALIEIYPLSTELFFNLVTPLIMLGKKGEAMEILHKIKIIDPKCEDLVNNLAQKHFNKDEFDPTADGNDNFNFLNLKNVVIIDPDDTVLKNVADILKEIGVENVIPFFDGEEAIKYLKENPDPDLICQEWRIPKIPGPLFLQKAKYEFAKSTPIIVLSSLIQREDMPLVREMGVSAIIRKPFERSDLLRTIIWSIQQDRMPTDQLSMERKIRNLLIERDFGGAQPILNRYMSDSKIPDGNKKAMLAEHSFYNENFTEARDNALEAIRQAGGSIFTLNLLGKTLMHLREFDVALKCFQQAQTLSPQNIERICAIAETQCEMGNISEANQSLEKAKNIDPENERIGETATKVAIKSGNLKKAKKLMDKLSTIDNVVAFMNNSAVAMINCDLIDKAIEQYFKTIKLVPEKNNDVQAIIRYNLALAYVKNGELEEAQMHCVKSIKLQNPKIHSKATSLMSKLTQAINKNAGIKLHSEKKSNVIDINEKKNKDQDTSITNENSNISNTEIAEYKNREIVATVEAQKGDMCCFLIYNELKPNKESAALIRNLPSFNPREAIERDETRGADKLLAASLI